MNCPKCGAEMELENPCCGPGPCCSVPTWICPRCGCRRP